MTGKYASKLTERPTYSIRPLAPSDSSQWGRLWQSYLAFYETTLDSAVTETTWARLLDHTDQPHGLCAANPGGEIAGIVHYLFHRSSWTQGDYCYLQDLYVDEASRGTGVGRGLIEAVYTEADKAGASQVYWLTQEFNTTARKLYDGVATLTPFVKYRRK